MILSRTSSALDRLAFRGAPLTRVDMNLFIKSWPRQIAGGSDGWQLETRRQRSLQMTFQRYQRQRGL
jgi:hypothetical protein